MHDLISRRIEVALRSRLSSAPVVALLGPRQVGKSTLAQAILAPLGPAALYLDLERPSDARRLTDPERFLEKHLAQLICIDEVQRKPDLFPVLRSLVDASGTNGRFLVLGSASPELLRQGSETLAGRISFLELSPFGLDEISDAEALWLRGGFPRSFLASSDATSFIWRVDFIRTFLERDVPQMGFRLAPESIRRLWQMLAHSHGQIFNGSKLGTSLGISHTTVRSYVDLLASAFLVRTLLPWEGNLKKRLVRSPKVYIRDSGVLHALLELESFSDLAGHPIFGHSFEGMVIENVLSALPTGWRSCFFRTASGDEIDLLLTKGNRMIALECKASSNPTLEKGFYRARQELPLERTLVVAPVLESYPLDGKTQVVSPNEAVKLARAGLPGQPY